MMKKITLVAVAVVAALGITCSGAMADECSGKDHTTGTILGGVGGGLIGGLASHGNGLAILGGALVGGLAGNAISRDMDCSDRPYAAHAYDDSFHGPVGRHYEWRNGGNRGYIVTNREYYRGRRLCRDFTQVVYRRGRELDRQGTACRRRDGQWEFM